MSRKLLMTLAAFLLVIGAAVTFYAVNRSGDTGSDSPQSQQTDGQDDTDAPGETVTKTGAFDCLQPTGDGPHTMECAFGLTEDDGTAYALQASDPTVFSGVPTGKRIEVSGTLSNPEIASKFKTAGTIRVTSLKEL